MNTSATTLEGLQGARPGREALPGAGHPTGRAEPNRRRRKKGGAGPDDDQPRSYYGLPVINKPVWEAQEIAGYFFLGGLAGASSGLALMAQLTGRPQLARGAKVAAAGAISLSLVALVKDLGRPARFLNMLRVFKPTSPMSVGTWVVSVYAPAALGAAASEITGALPVLGLAATAGAAALGPVVASYTSVLKANTAVPGWHHARRHLPYLFVSSAAVSAAGVGLLAAAGDEAGPPVRLAAMAAFSDVLVEEQLEKSLPPEVQPSYRQGKARSFLLLGKTMAVAGAVGAVAGRRSALVRKVAGVLLVGASACTRFGIFYAGVASAEDPMATIGPQKARLAAAGAVAGAGTGPGDGAAASATGRPHARMNGAVSHAPGERGPQGAGAGADGD